jgi:hypothetical protein
MNAINTIKAPHNGSNASIVPGIVCDPLCGALIADGRTALKGIHEIFREAEGPTMATEAPRNT